METLDNKIKYETVSLGTLGELERCNTIVLYRSYATNKLSLEKLTSLSKKSFKDLINTDDYVELNRINNNIFIYDKSPSITKKLVNGFNTIIYLTYKKTAIGYTEFLNVQGIIPEKTTITLNFKVENKINKEYLNINIDNDLTNIPNLQRTPQKIKKLLTEENKLYGLTNISSVNKEFIKSKDIYPRYTKSIVELLNNPNMSNYLGFGVYNSTTGFSKLNLVKEMTIAKDLVNHQLGYYMGEIVLYSWKKDVFEYSVHSMSKKDKFGNPICYTNTSTGTKSIKEYSSSTNPGKIKGIRYFSGKYISVTIESLGGKGDFFAVYNINTDNWVALDSENHIMDLWGIDSRILELPKTSELSLNTLLSFCPDIINTFIDLKNYSYKLDVVKKIGDWYVFNQTRQSEKDRKRKGDFKIYTNLNKAIVLSATENFIDNEPIVINNNILALKSNNYYTYFLKDGISYSENSLAVLREMYNLKGESISSPTSNIKPLTILSAEDVINYYQIKASCDIDNDFKNTNIYPNISGDKNNLNYSYGKELLIDHIDDNFINSFLYGFRKNLCPNDLKIPNIIGSINGLIYYKTKNNKIKLL